MHLPGNSGSRSLLATFALVLLIFGGGCGDAGKRGAFVARVNNSVLTEDDIALSRDSLGEPATLSREYVNEWIVAEMLYQEAERRGIADAPEFQQQLALTRKRLAVAALLQREVYASIDTNAITNEAIVQSFAASGPAFALREDLVQASLALFRDRDAANVFRSQMLRGSSWEESLRTIRADTTQRIQIVRTDEQRYFTRATMYPEELWKLARSLPREEVSFPLRTPEGYYLIRVHRTLRQGELPPLEYVRAEVREYLMMDLRRQRYEDFVGALRGKHRVDIRETSADSGASLEKE